MNPKNNALNQIISDLNIAQHGITSTPIELINTQFPKGDIIKGNVGTFWQNLVWDIIKVYHCSRCFEETVV
ncbi:MAG: hypothetical protein ACE5KT_01610 [Methanosarcinales archaeon]